MFPVSSVVRTVPSVSRAVVQSRNLGTLTGQVIAAPPEVKISFREKIFHGLIFTACIMAYPLYALVDVRKIKQAQINKSD